jgi:hypothetical protein
MAWWNTAVCKATCNKCNNGLPPCPRQASYQQSHSALSDAEVLSALRAINKTFVPPSTTPPGIQAFLGVVGDAKHAGKPFAFWIVLAALSSVFMQSPY